jgi:hypothetical protein
VTAAGGSCAFQRFPLGTISAYAWLFVFSSRTLLSWCAAPLATGMGVIHSKHELHTHSRSIGWPIRCSLLEVVDAIPYPASVRCSARQLHIITGVTSCTRMSEMLCQHWLLGARQQQQEQQQQHSSSSRNSNCRSPATTAARGTGANSTSCVSSHENNECSWRRPASCMLFEHLQAIACSY